MLCISPEGILPLLAGYIMRLELALTAAYVNDPEQSGPTPLGQSASAATPSYADPKTHADCSCALWRCRGTARSSTYPRILSLIKLAATFTLCDSIRRRNLNGQRV